LTSIEGNIELGGTVRMQVPEAPGRTFKVKVTRFVPNEEMVWRDGNPVIFLDDRTLFADAQSGWDRHSIPDDGGVHWGSCCR
jgi:hypothetical protein